MLYVNYQIKDCIVFTQKWTRSWILPSFYISTSIVCITFYIVKYLLCFCVFFFSQYILGGVMLMEIKSDISIIFKLTKSFYLFSYPPTHLPMIVNIFLIFLYTYFLHIYLFLFIFTYFLRLFLFYYASNYFSTNFFFYISTYFSMYLSFFLYFYLFEFLSFYI